MRFGSVVLAAVLALCAPAQSAAQNSPSPWARLASDDLKVIRQLIADNHPGPADRLNPGFLDWLEKGFAQVDREAAAARSFADYRRALRRYVNGFRDIHVALDLVPPMGPGVWPGFIVTAADDAGAKVAFSADEAVIPKGGFDSQNVPFWSDAEQCYVCYFRVFVANIRRISRTTSKDFITWTDPVLMGYGDGSSPRDLSPAKPGFTAARLTSRPVAAKRCFTAAP